ncbi:MAG: glycosyltransferase family 39 protein, partial [Chloroflexota bacterium]
GAFFRFAGLFENTFTADEALFAMWARYIATWRDPLLFEVPTAVDKPPLLFYLQGLFYPLQGPVEWAARLPNFLSSLMLIPLVGTMGYKLTKGNAARGWLAAAIVAFSPLAIQFSATAFTDPLLTFLVTIAVWHSVTNRELLQKSALWLGIAFWSKYQAILFVPLVWLMLWGYDVRKWDWRKLIRWSAVFGGCLVALFAWDAVSGGGIDLVSRQVSSYGGVTFTPAAELLPRLWEWVKLSLYVPGPAFLGVILILTTWWQGPAKIFTTPYEYLQGAFSALIVFIAGFLLFHWLINIQPWDRYLLLLVPVFALTVATFPRQLNLPYGCQKQRVWAIFLSLLFLTQAVLASNAFFPVGGRPDNDGGAAAIAQTIIDEPYGTVLYDHWYSWHWRYHFFWKGVYVEWFQETEDLVDNLEAFYDPNASEVRYLALRVGDPFAAQIESALKAEGYRLELAAAEGRIELYVIRK